MEAAEEDAAGLAEETPMLGFQQPPLAARRGRPQPGRLPPGSGPPLRGAPRAPPPALLCSPPPSSAAGEDPARGGAP